MFDTRPRRWWPHQRRLLDEEGYLIYGKYCSPELAKLASWLVRAISVIIILVGVGWAMQVERWGPFGYAWIVLIGHELLLGGLGFYRMLVVFLLGRKFRVIIAKDRVRLATWHGYRNYSVHLLPVTIQTEPHPKAVVERERMQMTGKKVAEYYGKTIQVIMRFGEQRVVIASIYNNQNKAEGLVTRLVSCAQEVQQVFGV